MANLQVINIVIKAYLPTGKTLDEQYEALTKVKEAHASGDYSELLKVATIEEVKTEQKTRRFEDAPQSGQNSPQGEPQGEASTGNEQAPEADPEPQPDKDDWSKPLTDDEKQQEQTATTRRRTRAE